jgi:kynurenine formamidase
VSAGTENDLQMIDAFGSWVGRSRIIPLGHQLKVGVPRYPSHPPFSYSLTNKLGEGFGTVPGQDPRADGASDTISLGVHTGSHQDSLVHMSWDGKLHDGTDIHEPGVQDWGTGIHMKSTDENMRAVAAPGILLDFPVLEGVEALPLGYPITPESMRRCADRFGVSINKGDVVLIRTGWDTKYHSMEAFLKGGNPGPTVEAVRMMIDAGVVASGADTMPYEAIPAVVANEVHIEMLVKAGVFIFETLDMRALSAAKAYRFFFVSAPLRIYGQTGSPVCPIAIVPAAS